MSDSKFALVALLLLSLPSVGGKEQIQKLSADQVNAICEARNDFSRLMEEKAIRYYGAELRTGRDRVLVRFFVDYSRYPGAGPVEDGEGLYDYSADGGLVRQRP